MPKFRAIGMALALSCVAVIALAAKPELKVLSVGETSISLNWDSAWEVAPPDSQAPANTAQFQTANPLDLMVQITAQPRPAADADVDAYMQFVMEKAIETFGQQSVEQKLEPKGFSNGGTRGYTVCATDRAPKPEEWKYVCQGIATNGDVAVIFTVLYNEAGKKLADKARKSLEALQVTQGT
jgi:hypothetical protein